MKIRQPDSGTSIRMASIRTKGTALEKGVLALLIADGLPVRKNVSGLAGTPDIVVGRSKAIFVHGCFWHGHPGCPLAQKPKRNSPFWKTKIANNRRRDSRNVRILRRGGWSVLTVWGCELRDPHHLKRRISSFLLRHRTRREFQTALAATSL
jgi:DNA mismatch endonuclease Vsr